MYPWTYCLITYGDLYARLYRKSDTQDDILFKDNNHNRTLNESMDKKEPLKEDVKLRVYEQGDHYIPYVQMVDNPGEMFDLQRFGKTHGYIRTPVRMVQQTTDEMYSYQTRYKMKQKDVEIFDAMSFVHASLENTAQRQPETVDIYLDNYRPEDEYDEYGIKKDPSDINNPEYSTVADDMTTSYTVKRGQSLLYSAFRVWRELNLLEMSALLNRLTQSSVVRILNIQVGSMPKEQVQNYIQRLKEKIEQKTALAAGTSMQEYNNPGPIINTIYVPQYGDKGAITATTIGGDFDPKSLTDINYFRDKLFGALGVPKQFFGFTDDGAGFNGGSSLTIISSQYGKEIKKLQSIMCQFVTDILNLFLIDRGLNNYVNKFTVRMQAPVTQEELDRRTNTDNRIRYVGDVMQQLGDIDDKVIKLKIYKSLLSSTLNDGEVMSYIDSYIDKLEQEQEAEKADKEKPEDSDETPEETEDTGILGEEPEEEALPSPEDIPMESINSNENKQPLVEDGTDEEESFLPTPEQLGLDLTK